MDPYEFENAVVPVENDLYLRVEAFPDRERYEFVGQTRDASAPFDGSRSESSLICCKLSMLLDVDDKVAVSVNVDKRRQQSGYAQYGSSHGNYQLSKQRMEIRVNIADLLGEGAVDVLAFEEVYANVRPLQ